MAKYSLGGVLSGKAGTRGKASRGSMHMLVDDELEAFEKRAAKRRLTPPYANEFVAAYAANEPHPTQSGVLKAWKAAGHGSRRRDLVLAAFDKLPGHAKLRPGRPPRNSQRK
jgi:hypothetical protein